jgi:hypothetical protein
VSIYFSASREQRQDLRRRQAVAERLRHHTLNRINAELARPADTDPPAYTATVHDIGHPGGES